MATINASSVEKVKQDAKPVQMLATDELRGRIRISKTTYTWLSGFVTLASTITGTLFPKGARVVGGWLASEAGASGHTLQVSINSVNLGPALVCTSAARQELPAAAQAKDIIGVDFGGFAPVITSAAADAVAGAKVQLMLLYVVD